MPGWELRDPAPHTKRAGKGRPLLCWVIGIQTSVPAVDPAMVHELVPAPLGCGLVALENTVLHNHPQVRASVEVQVSREVPAHCCRKKYKFGHTREEY